MPPVTTTPANETTSLHPSRRTVLKGAAAAAAAAFAAAGPLRVFDAEAAAAPSLQGIFGYGVASGDPTADAVIIWTRATPPTRPGQPAATPGSGLGKPLTVEWDVALDPGFTSIVRRGNVRTSADSDHTVKVDVTGLAPYTRYFYRFRAAGQTSPVGRTQTAPDETDRIHALRFALVTCSNYTGGYFTAYRAIASREDIDFVLHVGDYIYEYPNTPGGADGRYGPAALIGVRDAQPAGELLDLTDYRLRHALHKADPDAQAAHLVHPWITIFDDHEVANNTWDDGAENQPAGTTSAQFLARRRAAYQAYLEWMPFRLPNQHTTPHQGTQFFKRFTFGGLGDLSVVETRQNRSEQIDFPGFTTTGGGFIPTGLGSLTAATDAALADASRQLPEPEQMRWLKDGVSRRAHWHLIGNQVVLTPVRFPAAALAPTAIQSNGGPLPDDTLLINSDQWDGYQADQAELIAHLGSLRSARSGDVVVLTGDIHSSWVNEIPSTPAAGYTSVGVEIVTPSVTSDGFYEQVVPELPAGTPAEAAVAEVQALIAGAMGTNPWVKYLDGVGHGFTIVDVTPERVQADFYLTPTPTSALPDPRVDPTVLPTYKISWQTLAGTRTVSAASGPVGPRRDLPRSHDRRPGLHPTPRSRLSQARDHRARP